jgi:xylulokinase
MHKSLYILAHDLGTTGNKATLFDAASGTVVTTAFEAYETAYPRPNWAEHDPADWWRAVRDSTRELLPTSGVAPGDMAIVSFSGMMNGALAVDATPPLRPAIIWAD